MRRAAIASVFVVTLTGFLHADNWPQFRGTQGGVAADHPSLPDSWSPTQNIVWKLDVPGYAWSSPIVWGDHVFITSAINSTGEAALRPVSDYLSLALGGQMTLKDITAPKDVHRWVVYDIDFNTGKIRWERQVQALAPTESRHQKNSYASETPVTDGERVYAYFGSAGLFAFNLNGTPAWSKPMETRKTKTGWGSAASPAIYNGRVIIVNDNEEQSFIAAFDARTGRELWRVDRDETTNWSTPFVWENPQRTEIVVKGARKIRSYDLDGKLLWEMAGVTALDIPTPFASHGLLYLETGYPADSKRPVYAIRPGGSGDISLKDGETSNAYVAWSNPTLGTYATSPLVHGDYYYTLLDRGILICHDAKTGKEIYGRQRVTTEASGFTASPWAYNGRIFALSEDGDTYVIQAGPEFKVVGKNSLGEMALATPAIANGSLIVRTVSRVYRISKN